MTPSLPHSPLAAAIMGSLVLFGCQHPDPEHLLVSNDSVGTQPSPNVDAVVHPDVDAEEAPPADCRNGFHHWLFKPHEAPIPAKRINPRNSATRMKRLRDRITRVEIAHAYTHRPLFELSESGVAALREVPDWPPSRSRDHGLPPGKDWPVVLLVYLAGEDLPYAGHPSSNHLYFIEDEDPWTFYIMTDKGKMRDMHPIPLGEDVYSALEAKLGPPDPGGLRSDAAVDEYHDRCGRPVRPEPPSPFPNIPRAIIDAAEPVERGLSPEVRNGIVEPATPIDDGPHGGSTRVETDTSDATPGTAADSESQPREEICFQIGLQTEKLDALELGKKAAVRLRGGPYDFHRRVSDARSDPDSDENFVTFKFCGVIRGHRYDLTLERDDGSQPFMMAKDVSLDSYIDGIGRPDRDVVPIFIDLPDLPSERREDEIEDDW